MSEAESAVPRERLGSVTRPRPSTLPAYCRRVNAERATGSVSTSIRRKQRLDGLKVPSRRERERAVADFRSGSFQRCMKTRGPALSRLQSRSAALCALRIRARN